MNTFLQWCGVKTGISFNTAVNSTGTATNASKSGGGHVKRSLTYTVGVSKLAAKWTAVQSNDSSNPFNPECRNHWKNGTVVVVNGCGEASKSVSKSIAEGSKGVYKVSTMTNPDNTFTNASVGLKNITVDGSKSTNKTMTQPGPDNTFTLTGGCFKDSSDKSGQTFKESGQSTNKTMTQTGPDNTFTQTGGYSKDSSDRSGQTFKDSGNSTYNTMTQSGPENTFSKTGECSKDSSDRSVNKSKESGKSTNKTMTQSGPDNTFTQTGDSIKKSADMSYKTVTKTHDGNTISFSGKFSYETMTNTNHHNTYTISANKSRETYTDTANCIKDTAQYTYKTITGTNNDNTITSTALSFKETFISTNKSTTESGKSTVRSSSHTNNSTLDSCAVSSAQTFVDDGRGVLCSGTVSCKMGGETEQRVLDQVDEIINPLKTALENEILMCLEKIQRSEPFNFPHNLNNVINQICLIQYSGDPQIKVLRLTNMISVLTTQDHDPDFKSVNYARRELLDRINDKINNNGLKYQAIDRKRAPAQVQSPIVQQFVSPVVQQREDARIVRDDLSDSQPIETSPPSYVASVNDDDVHFTV